MLKSLEKNKISIIAIILFIVAIMLYNTFLKGETIAVPDDQAAQAVGVDLLAIADKLRTVSLNSEIFSSPLYKALNDFSVLIPEQPIGRTNPFDLIGR
jgi:hypothetical protein